MTAAFWKDLFNKLIAMLLPKIGGIGGWILTKIAGWGGQALYDLFNDYMRKLKRDAAQKEAIAKKDEVINNPDHTADEAGKAYEDMFNAGKDKPK